MCDELALTLEQYKRVITLLKVKGWVEVERHLFRGKVTPFIRLTGPGKELMLQHWPGAATPNPLGSTPTNQMVPVPANPLVAEDSNLSSTETTTETTTENTMATAKEVLMGFENPKTQTKAVSPSYLGLVWKQRVGLVTGQFVKSLTIADVGKLKHVLKGAGDQALPAMVYAIENWQAFKAEVWAKKGESVNPALPEVGFFVKHYDVAVQSVAGPPVPVAKATPASAPLLVPVVNTVDNPEPKVSAEQVLADLEAMKSKD
jgi:biotin carboxyl carrier protein